MASMLARIVGILLFFLLSLGFSAPLDSDGFPENGESVSLSESSRSVTKWMGIRYADKPVRWRQSMIAPFSTFNRMKDPECAGSTKSNWIETGSCLYLNIFAPTLQRGFAKKTVMVYLYGGGFQQGSPSLDMYDGSSLAANQDVIVVVPNYRTSSTSYFTAGKSFRY
jgi:carboxylesterase type B